MIRLLTAVLLFANFNAVAEVTLTPLNNNTPADADDVMGNFNALKDGIEANASAIDALPTPPADCTTDQIIRWNGAEWVCAWPAPTSGFAFEYVFNPISNYPPGEFSASWSGGDPASPTKSDVFSFRISYLAETGLDLRHFFTERYFEQPLDANRWISVTSASDPTDVTLYRVGQMSFHSDPTFVIRVEDQVVATNPDSAFIMGETYIIEFR